MFKRRWQRFGKLVSSEGACVSYGHKTVYFLDHRGKFALPYEDGILFPRALQVSGPKLSLTQSEVDQMVAQVVSALLSDHHAVEIFPK